MATAKQKKDKMIELFGEDLATSSKKTDDTKIWAPEKGGLVEAVDTSELLNSNGDRVAKVRKVAAKSAELTDFENQLFDEFSGESVLVFNSTGTEFHVPLGTNDPSLANNAIVFQAGEIKEFSKDSVKDENFRKCIVGKKLRLVSKEQAAEIAKNIAKENKKAKKENETGVTESGLPRNIRAAISYIMDCDNVDELEGYLQNEEREAISNLIEERLEELEEQGLGLD